MAFLRRLLAVVSEPRRRWWAWQYRDVDSQIGVSDGMLERLDREEPREVGSRAARRET